ncbi:hypothetical protein BDN67DRAFT_910461, partial [Paxillus ammoniavirescens]
KHILTDCSSIERLGSTIWNATAGIWPQQYGVWPDISLGTMLGCGSLILPPAPHNDRHHPPATRTARTQGASRLLRILISEAAHLIWVLRCERVIGDRVHTRETTERRWMNKLSHRSQLDRP